MTKHPLLSLPFLLLPVVAAGGCSSDESPRDHVPGTWQDLDDETGEPIGTVELTDDGTFSSTSDDGDDDNDLTGTWEATDEEMTLSFERDGEAVTMRLTYHADGDVLLAPALLPDGEVDGVVGSWRGELSTASAGESDATVETLELDEDGGAVRSSADDGEPVETDTGSWRQADGGWLEIAARNGQGQEEEMRFFAVPDAAIARDPLVRAD